MNYLVARVSDETQVKALPAQKQKLDDYAKKMKWVEGKDFKYIEFDETAYKENRETYWQLVIEPLQAETELAIVVHDKIDRFARDSSSDERRALTKLFRKGRIEMHFPSDNLFITKDSPASDLFRLDIGVALAAYYSSATRDNVRRRFEQMVKSKTWVGKAPIGYLNVVIGYDTDNRPIKDIQLDPMRKGFIKRGFELRSLGWSYGAIAKEMKEAGLVSTPHLGKDKKKQSRPLNKGKWEKIINNPFYRGEMRYMGQLYPHRYPVLIEPWLWFKCQRVKDERKHARTKYRSKPFLFKRLKCHQCGCSITFDGPKGAGRNVYGRCTGHKGKCTPKWVNEKVLIEQVKDILKSITIPKSALAEIVAEIEHHHESEQEYYKKHKQALQDEYDGLDEKIKRNFEDRELLKNRPDLFESIISEAEVRQKQILQALEDLGDGDKNFVAGATYIIDVCSRATELFESEYASLEQKRFLIDFVVSNMTLEGEKLHFTLKKPFDVLAKMQFSDTWCE